MAYKWYLKHLEDSNGWMEDKGKRRFKHKKTIVLTSGGLTWKENQLNRHFWREMAFTKEMEKKVLKSSWVSKNFIFLCRQKKLTSTKSSSVKGFKPNSLCANFQQSQTATSIIVPKEQKVSWCQVQQRITASSSLSSITMKKKKIRDRLRRTLLLFWHLWTVDKQPLAACREKPLRRVQLWDRHVIKTYR